MFQQFIQSGKVMARPHQSVSQYQSAAHRLLVILFMLAVCLSVLTTGYKTAYAREPQPQLPTIEISINSVNIEVEVAATPLHRNRGLSYRKFLPSNRGMLFVYQKSQWLIFTMRETSIPLSIAFVSEDLVINEIHKMKPWDTKNYPSNQPAQYALEVNQGWFERNGIKAGDKITLPGR